VRRAKRRDTAQARAAHRVPVAAPGEQAGAVLARLAHEPFEHVLDVWVVDGDGRLVGHTDLPRLLAAPATQAVSQLARPVTHSVRPEADQEVVASVALRHALPSVAVVDAAGRFHGAVTPPTLLRILRQEHVEDLHRLAGMRPETPVNGGEALEASPSRRVRERLPWLLIGLAGSAVATLVAAHFEQLLDEMVVVAFFVPAIVYLADAVGTQTEAIVVRGLSLTQLPFKRMLWGELRAGGMICATLGAASFGGVLAGFRDLRLAAAVGISIALAGFVAATIGLLLPWALARSGRDPALGAGPLATVIQDIVSLLIYFMAARLLLQPAA
jgi:magnesium transporter